MPIGFRLTMRYARFGLMMAVFLLASAIVPTGSAQVDPNTLAWIIDEEVHCLDTTIGETRNIVIYGAGRLVLEGCRLVLDPKPYENRWLGAADEGLKIHVLLGGRLEMRHSGTAPAVIEPADDRYGYRIDVDGIFSSDGRSGSPNRIRGLEGYMAENYIGGGIRVFGNGKAWLNDTLVRDIQGPALHLQGGEGHARNVTVRNASGAFAAVKGTLTLEDVDLNTGIEGIRVSGAELRLERVRAASDKAAVHATLSNVTVGNSTLSAYQDGLVLADSQATLANATILYGKTGILHRHEPQRTKEHRTITLQDSTLEARPGGVSIGLSAQNSEIRISNSRVVNHSQAGISILDASLHVLHSTFDGSAPTDVFATEPRELVLEGNSMSVNADRPVRVLYSVKILVQDAKGPIGGATVQLQEYSGQTSTDGKAVLLWEPEISSQLEPLEQAEVVLATHGGRQGDAIVTLSERDVTIALATTSWTIPGPGMTGVLATLGALVVAVRRRA